MGVQIFGRVVVLLLLGWGLWGLGFSGGRSGDDRGGVDVVLVVEGSAAARRKGDAVVEMLRRQLMPGSWRDTRIGFVRYGVDGEVAAPASQGLDAVAGALFSDASSRREPPADLADGLAAALYLGTPGRPLSLVVVAHGTAADEGSRAVHALLDRAAQAGVDVTWLDLRTISPAEGAWVKSVRAPPRVPSGAAVPVHVMLAGTPRAGSVMQLFVNGRLEHEQALGPAANASIDRELRGLPAGAHVIRARIAGGHLPSAQETLVTVVAPPPVLVVSRTPEPPVARSLAAGGWPVEVLAPEFLADGLRRGPAAVVLDDLPLAAMSASALDALTQAVRVEGTGLIALGGPHSFADGGYRDSVLEDLLPVTVTGTRPQSTTAVLFLVDSSGSMGRGGETHARRAVMEVAAAMQPGDLTGLYTFDVTLRRALPLVSRARPAAEIRDALRGRGASGGTHLAPALEGAMTDLMAAPARDRVLVLVTDGQLSPDDDPGALGPQMAQERIRPVAVVVGSRPAPPSLVQMTRTAGGELLRIDQVAELPRLVREEMERQRRREPVEVFQPVVVSPPVLGVPGPWPKVYGVQATRARDTARVALRAPGGAPLLALHQVGNGMVAALPAGLDAWVPDWLAWEHFGRVVGGLAGQVVTPWDNPRMDLRITDLPGGFRLELDALSRDGEWSEAPASVSVSSRSRAAAREKPMRYAAPGRYVGEVSPVGPGRQDLLVSVGDERLRAVHLHRPRELRVRQVLEPAVARGVVRPWPVEGALPVQARPVPGRWPIIVAAILFPLLLALPVLALLREKVAR